MTQARIINELRMRIGLIDARVTRGVPSALAHEIDAVRSIALRNGMRAAVAVAQALEMALARGERGPLITGWLDLLHDAVGSERHDEAACDTFRAACSVRLFG
jgi:hypothetical protein